MEDCMRLCMRKLALWYTKTFKPLMTHDELEPIMATMGFVGLPPDHGCSAVAWKEYVYRASPGVSWRLKSSSCLGSTAGEPPTTEPPRPKLPYPRIDGLHIYTYRAFLDAVNFYLEMCDISELFHIRECLFTGVMTGAGSGDVWKKMIVSLFTGMEHWNKQHITCITSTSQTPAAMATALLLFGTKEQHPC